MSQNSASPLRYGPDGQVQVICHHDEEAVRRTSHTAANPDRSFYRCYKNGDDACKFFKWEDEIQRLKDSTANIGGPGASTTPAVPPPSTPRKRPAEQQDDSARLLATEKRRKLIEDTLNGLKTSRSVPTTPTKAPASANGSRTGFPMHSPAYSSQAPLTPPSSQDDNPFSSPGRGPQSSSQDAGPSSSRGKQRALPLFKEESPGRLSMHTTNSEFEEERTVEYFADHVDAMNGLYDYASKLENENREYKATSELNERRKRAAEQSSEAKSRKITELTNTVNQQEAQIQRLIAQVKELQEQHARDGRTLDALHEAMKRSQ